MFRTRTQRMRTAVRLACDDMWRGSLPPHPAPPEGYAAAGTFSWHAVAKAKAATGRLSERSEFADRPYAVGGGLIRRADLGHGAVELIEREILAHLERVEAHARHEGELVGKEI